MRVLIQRVTQASVEVKNAIVGQIGKGLLVFVGVGQGDNAAVAEWMVKKVAGLRIFEDTNGQTNLSVEEVGAQLLVVSQFTLYADAHKGRRPSFIAAALPQFAEPLLEGMLSQWRALGLTVATGCFGASMQVHLTNDGPFTLWLEREAGTA